ncbi:MAG TPA: hypothetical protein V6C52_06070 [Coleofasciculaceae cyanobacterium]
MQSNQWTLSMNRNIYSQFNRMKNQGHFHDDQDLLRAAFEALDREWRHEQVNQRDFTAERYMKHPGLGLDDYDT